MADINHVVLVGRLTRDAELKYTNNGTAVSRLSIAVNQRRKVNDQWVDEANFFNVVLWGKIAESLDPYLKKGKQIGIEGRLQQNRWEQEGQTRSRVEIIASNIQLLGGRGSQPISDSSSNIPAEPFPESTDQIEDDFEDDIPF